MRIDKFLKISRIIKRRTIASEACEQGKVSINSKIAKPSSSVKEGDIIEITFGERVMKVRVECIKEHALKDDAPDMYSVI